MAGDCAEFLDQLDPWIDGDLEAGDASRMRAHADGCATCRNELRFAEAVRGELREMPGFDAPERVLVAVNEATKPSVVERLGDVAWMTPRPVRAAIAMAAVVALLLVVAPRGDQRGTHYTEAEIRRAAAETRLALSYVSDATRRAERGVRRKVLEEREFPATVRGISRTLSWAGEAGTAHPAVPTSPANTAKGS